MSDTADPAARALAVAYITSACRCRHRPLDSGERGKGSVRREADRWAARVLAGLDPSQLPADELLADVVLLGEARRQLANGRRDVARDLASVVVERLSQWPTRSQTDQEAAA